MGIGQDHVERKGDDWDWSGVRDDVVRRVAEAASDMLAWIMPGGRLGWASQAMCTNLGLDAFPADIPLHLIHPDHRSMAGELGTELLAAGMASTSPDFRVRFADGSYHWVNAQARPLPDEGGAALSVHDIGARRELQRERDAADRKYEVIAKSAFDIVYQVDEAAVVEWILPSVRDCLGWTADEVVGRAALDLIHPDDREAAAELASTLLRGGAAGQRPEDRPTLRMLTADGGFRWMSGTAQPQFDSDGVITGALIVLRDVSSLVEARLQAESHVGQLRATVDNMLDPFVVLAPVCDGQGRICDFEFTLANEAAAVDQQIGIDDLVGSRFEDLFPRLREQGVFDAYVNVLESGQPLILDDLEVFNDVLGESRRYDIRASKSGENLVLTWRDITARHALQQQLAQQEAVYRMATESAYDAVFQVDSQGVVMWVSPSFERLTGYPPEELLGRSIFLLVDEEDLSAIESEFEAALSGRPSSNDRVRLVTAEGASRWVQFRSRVVGGQTPGDLSLMTMLRDIDQEVVARRALEENLRQDPLTGVATWPVVREELARAQGKPQALLCIGVDRLRAINEAVSYAGGDEVLVQVAKRIRAALPPQAIVGRIAGNEFVVAAPDSAERTLLAILADQISKAVGEPVLVAGQEVRPTVSIGIAEADEGAEELLRRASLAARSARSEGGGRWRFDDPVVAAEAERRLWVETRLRKAIREGDIEAWFQPVVSLRDSRVVGYEALVRWPQGDGRVLPPSEFLNVAEASGLVVDLDFQVLEQALTTMQRVREVTVSVNVSARTLTSPDYAVRVAQVLERSGVDPARLRLEVTETALLFDHAPAVRATTALAVKGVKWWLDDFGTGYSTLSHLRDFPISGIKLDRSFTVGVGQEDLAATRLARALLGMAKGLGLETVAEGIENEAQLKMLRVQGWRKGQGWLFGKAAPL